MRKFKVMAGAGGALRRAPVQTVLGRHSGQLRPEVVAERQEREPDSGALGELLLVAM